MNDVVLSLLFFLSGFCGLIYEVVWERWLELRFGVTTFAAAVIVAAFMGGMALGSLILGHLSDRSRRPLRFYAACEIALGLYALAMPWLVATPWGGARPEGAIWFLIFPTMMMGGTVPSLCRHADGVSKGRIAFAWLYGLNILGGVVGCLVVTVYLLQAFGAWTTNALAATISLTIGLVSLVYASEIKIERPASARSAFDLVPVALAFVFGALSLASEVLWFRALRLVIGGTVYSFGTMLSTYLLGLALGSLLVTGLKKISSRPLAVLGVTQIWTALFFGVGFPAFVTSWGMLNFFNEIYFARIHSWLAIHVVHFLITCGVLLIPAALMGMALPLLVQHSKSKEGSSLGVIYGANSLGAVLGSLAAGFMMIPAFGLEASAYLICGLETVLAILLLLPRNTPMAARLTAVPALGLLMTVGSGFHGGLRPGTLYKRDGVVSTISVYMKNGRKVLETDNLDIQGMDPANPLTNPKRLGYLPLLLHSGASDSALQIGLGTGINLSALAEGVKETSIVELIPEMPEAVAHFEPENGNILHKPNVKLVIDDGRHWVAASSGRYDLIVGDLFYPENAGTASLYSREHFLNCRRALNKNGTMIQWLPAHQMTLGSLKTLVATFRSVFPDASLWWGTESESIPTVALIGRLDAKEPTLKEIDSAMRRYSGLKTIGWERPECVASLRIMSGEVLADFAVGAPLNTDDLPRIEYDAPRLETRRGEALFETLMNLAKNQEREAVAHPIQARLFNARAAFTRAHAWRSAGRKNEFEAELKRAKSLAPECREFGL